MSRTLIRFSIPLIGSAIAAFGMFACSSDKNAGTATDGGAGTTSTAGGATGTGGGTGTGGKSTGGTTGTGGIGAGGAAVLTDPYTCLAKPSTDPGGTGKDGDPCCTGTLGSLGKCAVTKATDAASGLGHDSCGPTLTCNADPQALGAHPDAGAFEGCAASIGGTDYEGRCIPKCLLIGSPTAGSLTQSTCSTKDFVCTPCFSPTDGKATGACTAATGGGPTKPAPAGYQECGGLTDAGTAGRGLCVPKVLAASSPNPTVAALKQDDCKNATDICIPALTAENPSACFAKCTSFLGGAVAAKYGPGACIPTFVVRDTSPTAVASLKKDDCTGADELCVPCRDPNASDKPTHACE